MRQILYLTQQGTKAAYRDGQIIIFKGAEILGRYSAQVIKSIYIFGNVELSSSLINLIFKKSIDCIFLTIDGRFKGRLLNPNLKSIKLRLKQYELYKIPEKTLKIAQDIVSGKISNQRYLLMKFNRGQQKEISAACVKIRRIKESIGTIQKAEELLGVEGLAGKYFWSAYAKLLKKDYGFRQREMHPPPDPVNAALSFGYTILGTEIGNYCQIEGLDLYAGVYHVPEDRRASLALDLIEEFRTPVVDYTVLRMVNLRIFDENDFEEMERGIKVYLNAEGRAKLIYNLRERLSSEISYKNFKRKIKLIMAIKHQIETYKSMLRGESDYTAYEWLD